MATSESPLYEYMRPDSAEIRRCRYCKAWDFGMGTSDDTFKHEADCVHEDPHAKLRGALKDWFEGVCEGVCEKTDECECFGRLTEMLKVNPP